MQNSRRLPAASGWNWFVQALSATQKQPIVLMGVVLFYMLSMSVLSVIPLVGPVLAAVFMPYGTVFLGHATRDALAGRSPHLGEFSSLVSNRSIRPAMLRIGLVFAVALLAVNALFGLLSAGDIAQWQPNADNTGLDWDSVRAHMPWTAVAVSLAVYIPALMAVWFAPLLAADKGMACGKSLFFSFFGCLRNLLPIIVLGVVLSAITLGLAWASIWLMAAWDLTNVAAYVLMPVAFILSTVIYASYWPMYADLFDDVA